MSRLQFPSVLKLLTEHNLSASLVSSSGRFGLLKGDVLKYIKDNKIQKSLFGDFEKQDVVKVEIPQAKKEQVIQVVENTDGNQGYEDIPVTNMRKVIAERLTFSKQSIPYAYYSQNVDARDALQFRSDLLEKGIKVSMNDLVLKAAAKALQLNPVVNGGNTNVDISVAVSLPDGGLITPVLKNSNHKSLSQISSEVRELAGLARDGKLLPEQYQGGTFSVSNLGMFGISKFTAIINPPQDAILSVSSVDPSTNRMNVTLNANAAKISENEAAKFLDTFETNMSPMAQLL